MPKTVQPSIVMEEIPPDLREDERVQAVHQMMKDHWEANPELYHAMQQKRARQAAAKQSAAELGLTQKVPTSTPAVKSEKLSLLGPIRGAELRHKIRTNQADIRQRIAELGATVVPLTQAANKKNPHQTLEEERAHRADVVAAQLKVWRSVLPDILRQFSKLPDYRRANSVQHKIAVVMMFGLLAFIFRLSSRRDMNRELTGPVIVEQLKKLFPDIDSIPHADTLARLLAHTNPKRIEAIHVNLIKSLIKKKKFKSMLIHECLPITIDGTQKLFRQGLLQDSPWCERTVGHPQDNNKQQYLYTIEADITLKNGLTIPLMTEYLTRENNRMKQPGDGTKQDNETTAFERLAERLKHYFPRQKMIVLMDSMYATQTVMGILHQHRWEYLISLPTKKLTDFAKQLNEQRGMSIPIPHQPAYRGRQQTFHWVNHIAYGYDWQLSIHLVACLENYEEVDKKTGDIVKKYSQHAWISSIPLNIHNVHELLNLGARKKELIEDSINTEKNRGYHYKHAFSYDWNAFQGFHHLMRLAHAINALSRFAKGLKQWMKSVGYSATLTLIKDTLFSPWLSLDWYEQQTFVTPQLRFQLE